MRAFWTAFGLFTQGLFGVTVVLLFLFLWDEPASSLIPHASITSAPWPVVDLILLLQFAVSHSLLLMPATRKRLSSAIPGSQYGIVFCFATCLSLIATITLWQSGTACIWSLQGTGRKTIHLCLLASWVSLFYSISLTGLGYQTGWTPWFAWIRGIKLPPRPFVQSGAYRFIRHPVYLSFLGLIWFNPTMTIDRALLGVVWSAYIFIGSELKDRRLEFYIGNAYRQYRQEVGSYPWSPRFLKTLLTSLLASHHWNPASRVRER